MKRPTKRRPRRTQLHAWIGQETYRDAAGQRKTQATWSVKYRRNDKSVWERGFTSEADAIAWWAVQRQNLHRPVEKREVVKEKPMTLGEYFDRWLAVLSNPKTSKVGAGALRQYKSHLRKHLRPSLGDVLLEDLERSPGLIEEAMASWERQDGRAGDLAPLFVKKIWSTLRTSLNKAVKQRIMKTNPCDYVDPPKVERKEMLALDAAQALKYMAAFDLTPIGAAVATAIGSGLRLGELLALPWKNVNLDRGTLRVERSLERVAIDTKTGVRYEIRFKEPKSRQSRRTVPLPPFVVQRLRKHRLEQAERFLAAGVGRPDDDALVFDCDGKAWVPTSFGLLYASLRDKAGLKPRVRFHDLRHSYASLLLESGADLKTVSAACGHSSIGITSDLYLHLKETMVRSAVDRLGVLVEGGGENPADASTPHQEGGTGENLPDHLSTG